MYVSDDCEVLLGSYAQPLHFQSTILSDSQQGILPEYFLLPLSEVYK